MRDHGTGLRQEGAALWMHVQWYGANANITQRENEKEKKKERDAKKDKPQSFAYPAASLILPASLFIFRHVNQRCTNEGLHVFVPSYRAIASAPVIWRTLKYIDTVTRTQMRFTRFARVITKNIKKTSRKRQEEKRASVKAGEILYDMYMGDASRHNTNLLRKYIDCTIKWEAYRVYWHFEPSNRNYRTQCILLTPRKMEAKPSPYPINRAITLW